MLDNYVRNTVLCKSWVENCTLSYLFCGVAEETLYWRVFQTDIHLITDHIHQCGVLVIRMDE